MQGRKRDKTKGPEEKVHIVLKNRNREALRKMGTMEDSFDDVIERLITFYHENRDKAGSITQTAMPGGETQREPGIMA